MTSMSFLVYLQDGCSSTIRCTHILRFTLLLFMVLFFGSIYGTSFILLLRTPVLTSPTSTLRTGEYVPITPFRRRLHSTLRSELTTLLLLPFYKRSLETRLLHRSRLQDYGLVSSVQISCLFRLHWTIGTIFNT